MTSATAPAAWRYSLHVTGEVATDSRPLYNQTEGGGAEAAFAECSQTRATEIRHESQRRDA
jgi:hypothetical protein